MSEQMGSAEIADIVQQMDQSGDDPRRAFALVQQRIKDLRRDGRSVPDDLMRLERGLMVDCMAESQGR